MDGLLAAAAGTGGAFCASLALSSRTRIHVAEHRMIYEAIVAGDPDAAAFYSAQHINRLAGACQKRAASRGRTRHWFRKEPSWGWRRCL